MLACLLPPVLASSLQRLRAWVCESTNLPPEAHIEFKIVTSHDTIKARWELDWDSANLGPQALDFLYTGDVPEKVFVAAKLPVAG
eukprot:SAG22_NODE_2623_length_2364_cov_1.576600_2_plen_85_part_00